MPCRRALPTAGLLAGVVLLAAACSTAGPAAGGAGHHHGHAAPATGAARTVPDRAAPGRATGVPVRVVMDDRFRYQPSSITVQAGHRVTFAVHNAGRLPHEFILGDRATQLDHERQMQAAPSATGRTHDHMHDMAATGSGALTVPPGATRNLTWTFDKPGTVLYGCHVLGHWAAGMKGTIVVLSPDRPMPRGPLSPSRLSRARAER